MTLSNFIREEIQNGIDQTLAPIIENLSKYLVKELRENTEATIRWEYEEEDEEVNEDRAFVYYKRKVALIAWLREQGFCIRNATCFLSGAITGIKVSL